MKTKRLLFTIIIFYSFFYFSTISFGFDLGGALNSITKELEKGTKELEQGLQQGQKEQPKNTSTQTNKISQQEDAKWDCEGPTYGAARKDNVNAAYALANCLLTGKNTQGKKVSVVNGKRGTKWMKKAAELGHVQAKKIMAAHYAKTKIQNETQQAEAATMPTENGCLAGQQKTRSYDSIEVKMRWQDKGGEFSRCLNQSHPDKNNFKNSWGHTFGEAWYKCGDLSVYGYVSGARDIEVCPKPGLEIGPDKFGRVGPKCKKKTVRFTVNRDDEKKRFGYDEGKRKFCKKNGESSNCFNEVSSTFEYLSDIVPKKFEVRTFRREVTECETVGGF